MFCTRSFIGWRVLSFSGPLALRLGYNAAIESAMSSIDVILVLGLWSLVLGLWSCFWRPLHCNCLRAGFAERG